MKQAELIKQMTIEEKAAFLSGKNMFESRDIRRLGIPSIFCADGPHGLRKQTGESDHLGIHASMPATCFPPAATIANSWDTDLGELIGQAIGAEAAAQNVNVLLGPGLNIKRSPLCGRNFEYFSEDPYLSGKLAAAYVRGIQSQDVYACPKHFAVNSQELRRMAMNSVIDERTLREIYLEGFEIAVQEGGAKAIMSSYNEVNGVYANENAHLLQDILRQAWGFDGIVISDWGGSNDHVRGVAAGSNLEMPFPGRNSARELVKAVENGELSLDALDQCVDDLLDAVLKLKGIDHGLKPAVDFERHHQLTRKAAQESIVLLKNNDQILPLHPDRTVALIGDFAATPRYQGAGSSVVNPTKIETMQALIGSYPLHCMGYAQGYDRNCQEDEVMRKAALELASQADAVIYCFGLDEISESEGLDRNHMRIPQNQIDLLESLVKINKNIIGVISAGSAIEMPWHYCLKAILHGTLGGQAGAGAALDVLIGKINPSGRLSETYPLKYEDTPAFLNFPSTERNAEYRESLFVGYRYYETCHIKVQYPFGFGLSYTSFAYQDIVVAADRVTFTLTNTGTTDGSEVAQLYVRAPQGKVFRPSTALKGFAKVFLAAGQSQNIEILFDDKTFRYWNTATNDWEIEAGDYILEIGANVKDIRLSASISQSGTTDRFPNDPDKLISYFSGLVQQVEACEFELLLGHPIPPGRWSGELGINDALCQMYYAKGGLARLAYRMLTRLKTRSEEKGKPDLNILFNYNMPFRAMAKMTNGLINMEMVRGIVLIVNGHFFKGLSKLIAGLFHR